MIKAVAQATAFLAFFSFWLFVLSQIRGDTITIDSAKADLSRFFAINIFAAKP